MIKVVEDVLVWLAGLTDEQKDELNRRDRAKSGEASKGKTAGKDEV